MTDTRLEPCPFCGGEAKRFTIGDDEPNNAGGDCIGCTRCGASSHVEFGRKENLVSRWNARATLDASGEDWQPIETAPKDGTDILAWWFGVSFPQIVRWAGHAFYGGPRWVQCSYESASLSCKPTHWKPLPEPPAAIARSQEGLSNG